MIPRKDRERSQSLPRGREGELGGGREEESRGEDPDPTYHRDGDGCQRKGVPDDVVHAHGAHARGPAALHVHLPVHFSERGRVQRAVRGHVGWMGR